MQCDVFYLQCDKTSSFPPRKSALKTMMESFIFYEYINAGSARAGAPIVTETTIGKLETCPTYIPVEGAKMKLKSKETFECDLAMKLSLVDGGISGKLITKSSPTFSIRRRNWFTI